MGIHPARGNASMVRAHALIQIALGISQDRSNPDRPYRDIRVSLGSVREGAFHAALSFATGPTDIAFAVARGEIDLAALNPSAFLTMACRGTGPFSEALPLRAIAVMPSWDRMVFAIAERTGLTSLADARDRRYPLRVSLRGSRAHSTRFVVDEALAAARFSLEDIQAWGGTFQYVDTPSDPARLQAMRDGTIDAVFDEGIKGWGNIALEAGMQFVPLNDATLRSMEALGWPAGPIPRGAFPRLREEVMALSFSGWPLFTHAGLPEETAYQICRALDAARPAIAWDSDRPVELSDLCRSSDAAPLDVPLHPGAERYYREHGAFG